MAKLWIVHRDPRWRDALVAMAAPLEVLAADPVAAAGFDATQPPRAVLLGVAGDFEAELEFAHRFGPRLREAAWVLLARPLDAPEVARLFDALPATLVSIASDAVLLRRRLRAALARRRGAALSTRRRRDALGARFARWFGDLESPALLAATDPARAALPLVVRGEPGTGRGLLARYLHAVAADAAAPFAAIACEPDTDPLARLDELVPETGALPSAGALTVCFENVDRLAPAAQRALRAAIEAGAAARLRAAGVRWIATAGDPHTGDDALDPELARALAGLVVRVPPLRERPAAIDSIAAAVARAFAASRGQGERRFEPAALEQLRAHPWPGNHRELEAVLNRTLAASSADPIPAADLAFEQLEPLDAGPELASDEGAPARDRATGAGEAAEGVGPGRSTEPRAPEARPARDAAAPMPAAAPEPAVRRLSAAVAHEVGNPLVGIRTYAAMLPTRFDDPEFRSQFAERVESDTRRIEAVIETLHRLGSLETPAREPVDVSSLLARLLERDRARIRDRRLVVLEELERARPFALGDAEQLRFAFGLLLDAALGWLPARADLYVATRRQDAPAPRLRVLLRFHAPADRGLGFGENALAVAAVEAVVLAHGGAFALDAGAADETAVRIELPAPPEGAGER